MIMDSTRNKRKASLIRRKQKTEWLSNLIKKELKQYPSPGVWERITGYFSTIYFPSKKTIALILCLVGLVLLLTNSGRILTSVGLEDWILFRIHYYPEESNQFQNLISIHAGVGAIIFALIILVAESLRDNQSKDTAQVLLKVSYLFPLTVAEIFVFFLFLLGDVNFLSVVSVITIAIFTVVSLKNTINVLLDKPFFTTKRIELLTEGIEKNIDQAIDERVGNNLLLPRINNPDLKLEYRMFMFDETNYHVVNSNKFGVVTDINIGLLVEIAEIIQGEADKNIIQPNRPETPIFESQTTETSRTDDKNDVRLYVHKRYKENIIEGNRALLYFHKSYVEDDQVLEIIQSKAQKAFRLAPEDNFDELVKSQLSALKGQFIDAIANREINIVEELSKIFIGVTEGYLNLMEPYGGGFSFEQAQNERAAALMGGWEQMRWLVSDIRSLVIGAIQSKNLEIIIKTTGLPIRISRLALQNDDHYLFQEFAWFPELFYRYSQKEEVQQEIKSYLYERSWKHFQNLSDYYIETKFKKNIPDAKKHSLKDFAVTLLMTFQNLLKAAYDNKDIEGFRKFQQTTLSLFRKTNPGSMLYEIEFINSLLENQNLSKERQEQLRNQLEVQMLFQEIHNRRFQMFFGLASWIFDEYKNNQEDRQVKDIYNYVQSVFDISLEEFTKIFLDAHSFDVEDFWNWDRWDSVPDGRAHFIRILEKLEQFFAVKTLSMLAGQTKEEIDQIEFPYNRDFAYLAGGTRDLVRILDAMTNNPDNWQFVLSEDAIEKVDVLKDLLLQAKEKQENDDVDRKRATAISEAKVKTFNEDFINGFYENADLRRIIEMISTIEKRLSETPREEIKRFGFNTVDDKAAFFDDWHVYFGDWGESYGRNLALGENSAILKKIIESCERLDRLDFQSVFAKFENKKDMLILLVNSSSFSVFREEEGFRYQNSRKDKRLSGVFQFQGVEIPIYQFFQVDADKQIIILDKNILSKLIQYSPLEEGENEELIKEIFFMDIQSFGENEDLMNEMLENPPDWLQENRDREAQRLYLEERVLVKVQECFELILSDDYQGYNILTDN